MNDRDCNTCRHHVQGASLETMPPGCWDCGAASVRPGSTYLPFWQPIKKDNAMSKAYDAVFRSENPMVSNPPHYTNCGIEPINVIEDWNLNFNLGNALKYIKRADHKGNKVQDLEKAIWYIQRELSLAARLKEKLNDCCGK